MRISIYPALNGDCILVEYNDNRCILIDGGYVDTYNHHLLPCLSKMVKEGKSLDLLIVTHIDTDHISGIIKLLDEKTDFIPINNIWYNGYRHIQNIVVVSDKKETVVHKELLCNYVSL